MALDDIQARARAKAGLASSKARASYFVAADKARKLANLRAEGYVIPLSEWIGHNNGPAWDVWDVYVEYCWKEAHKKAWTPSSWEIGLRRAQKAEALGLSYKQYTLEILERGRYLDEESAKALKPQ